MPIQQLQTRELFPDPSHPRSPFVTSGRKIKILHPGYKDETNILFQFDAYDANGGAHYETIHTACAIVAQNRWDGYFSTDVEGRQRIERSNPDESLLNDKLYFQVPGGQ